MNGDEFRELAEGGTEASVTTGKPTKKLSWEEITALRPFEWLIGVQPLVISYEGVTVFRFPMGRLEAVCHRTGAFLLLREGDALPCAGEVWRAYKSSAAEVATSLIGGGYTPVVLYVRRAVTLHPPATSQEAVAHRGLWAAYAWVEGGLRKIGDWALTIDSVGNLVPFIDLPLSEMEIHRGAFPLGALGRVVC